MRKLLWVLSFVLSFSSFATEFDNLHYAFTQGYTPVAENLFGYWAGRCVNQGDPNEEWPAFYAMVRVESPGPVHPFSLISQSHTWFSEHTNKYDFYTVQDVHEDPSCKA